MNRTKTMVITVLCITLLLMVTGYAYFATNLRITTTGNIASTWKVYFSAMTQGDPNGTKATNKANPTFTDTTATMHVDLKTPGDEMTYELTVTNEGHIGGIVESIDAEATGSPAIIFSISGVNKGDKIASGESKIMTVKIQYDPAVVNQPLEITKTLTITINVVQDAGQIIPGEIPDIDQPLLTQLGHIILNDNVAYADNVASPYVTASTGIDFTKINSDTNGKGLYYTSTNTEDNKVTYYFRGDVQNNYVKFGKDKDGNDLYWRIIRINEDGSVRLIYQGTSATATGSNATIGDSAFNEEYQDNAYLGYMYGTPGSSTYALAHANDNPSTIKTFIDDWYLNDTNLSNYVNSHLADAGFCNDRSVVTSGTGTGTTVSTYGSYTRLYNNKLPRFACPNASNDLFTTSASSKGNKALINPIGLITADEVNYAGGRSEYSNSKYYLYTGEYYWTMTPRKFTSGGYAYLFTVRSEGYLNDHRVFNAYGVRPVINLKSRVIVESGNGTAGNPYVVKTN